MICNPVAGQNTQGILYKATEGISTVAAGAAAVACPSVRHKAAQTAAVLHPSYRRTLLAEQISAASGTAAATATATCPAAAACEDRLFPACSGDETTEAAAAAAEASRAAFLREELLNLAESRYTAVFVPVDKQLLEQMNDEFIRSDISRYPVKNTPSGIVFYSPRYSDDRFIYRHVLLSAGVKKAAEEIANATKSAFLTEGQFIYQLGIHLSPGWEHFMVFKGEMRELILRRPQQQQDSPNSQNQAYSDEISEESDDSEPEEPTMVASATESPLPPPRHQDLVRLLQQAAETATIHQAKQQKDLLQQQMAIARAVEKANRLLLLIVQLQRPPQHVPPKMFDRMKCLLTNYFFSSVPHYSSEEGQHQLSTARKYLLQNGNFGKQGQLLLLLLQCVAASRQHQQASEAMELPLLQHKMLRQQRGLMQHNAPRISVRGVEKHQQILTPSCAIEAPQDLHERQWEQQEDQREDQQQQKQSTNRQNATRESCRDDGSRRNSSCCGASALRLRKRRGPSLTSPLPVATPHTDSLPRQQQGKRQSGCCNTDAAPDDNAIGSDAASGLANVALPRGFAAKGKAANLPAAATGAISSPTSQRKKKRRRYPLRH
ncbi:cyclin-dependent kinase, putative [Eimeria praecox]|uniref:Cyclin-dependent kinases regulatory subunit n=1 Tax=Eimeria praecox TaxID=51316 RepID=U6H5X9_9EIME|nr:cyclin-dependent kinase, putative [Eimeria praecox]